MERARSVCDRILASPLKQDLPMTIRKNVTGSRGWLISLIALALWSFSPVAPGVILFRTGDPAANTTEPTGALAGSGWQYQGTFGDFLGTAIAPHFFVTAKHIGTGPATFLFHGVNYSIVNSFADPDADFRIFEVAGTLPVYAPLYRRSDEVGQHLVVFGRGSQRGPERIINGQLRGWNWGAGDGVQRWGENQVASITGGSLHVLFDQGGLPQEAHLSGGDSGGGIFLKEGNVWKLAAINSDVDHFASGPDGGGPYNAAMFDERGSYLPDGTLVSGKSAVPSGFYAARISPRIAWINSIIGSSDAGLPHISAGVTLGTLDRVCIGGFISQDQLKRVDVRGLGPSLEGEDTDIVVLRDFHGGDNWKEAANSPEIAVTRSALAVTSAAPRPAWVGWKLADELISHRRDRSRGGGGGRFVRSCFNFERLAILP